MRGAAAQGSGVVGTCPVSSETAATGMKTPHRREETVSLFHVQGEHFLRTSAEGQRRSATRGSPPARTCSANTAVTKNSVPMQITQTWRALGEAVSSAVERWATRGLSASRGASHESIGERGLHGSSAEESKHGCVRASRETCSRWNAGYSWQPRGGVALAHLRRERALRRSQCRRRERRARPPMIVCVVCR